VIFIYVIAGGVFVFELPKYRLFGETIAIESFPGFVLSRSYVLFVSTLYTVACLTNIVYSLTSS
jgi:hypothetical protein